MTSHAAVANQGLVIPLIDFSKFLNGGPHERQSTAQEILHGFQTAGFIYLKNHPIPAHVLQRIFIRSATFFALDDETKLRLQWTTPEANRGYSSPGREKASQLVDVSEVSKIRTQAPDLKESLEIGRDTRPEFPNQWPDEGDNVSLRGFRKDMVDFFRTCQALHVDVMRAIALGMGLEQDFFDQFINASDNNLRLLHYPGVKAKVFKLNPGQTRAGEHSDYGSITLLFQDSQGGLQVKSPTGDFVDATPIEGTIVVNAGDLLARWSNDTIRSTIHRVVEPPSQDDEHPARYSIAYFCNANLDSFIETLPGTYATEQDKKYKGVKSGEYLVQRLRTTY
ncbi:related to gibberellin 20-oxidase [Claviceps purpurea 20.1]|uniref:Related to gibberellin 20-oxidase n=1 Tax=Claviceps purpurea (strain 20.1) TaxID=1111077 RepID=M1WAY5_CLAP2|nr:related to gibberellin 20-oxidase [Claviceps purpurea 20.1]